MVAQPTVAMGTGLRRRGAKENKGAREERTCKEKERETTQEEGRKGASRGSSGGSL